MSKPCREGARKSAKFVAISTAPSIKLTPVGDESIPLPYNTIQDLSNSVAVVPNVTFNGDSVYVLEQSIQPNCQEDEEGGGRGVISGTVGGYVKPTGASTTFEPVVPNPAKSTAQTSDPTIVLATPQGVQEVSGWLNGVVDDIAGELNEVTAIIEEWWDELQAQVGDVTDNPWKGIQDGVEQILGMGTITDEVIK